MIPDDANYDAEHRVFLFLDPAGHGIICAVREDFTNIQECSMGTGDTHREAILDLLDEEARNT